MKQIKICVYYLFSLLLMISCTSKISLISKSNQKLNFSLKDTILVKNIRQDNWSDSLVVKFKSGYKKTYSVDSVWGYKNIGGGLYRYYNGKFYHVKKTGFITIYTQHHNFNHLNYRKPHNCYYFSKTHLSNLLLLNSNNLSKEFSDNGCFVKLIKDNLAWYKDYASYEKVNGSCMLFEYYNYCIK